MRRPVHHAKPTMTRAQNRTAFTMWLNGCSDEALRTASATSIGRSYGLDPSFVAAEIRQEINRRQIAARIKGNGQ